MKLFAAAALEALERGDAIVSGAVAILSDPPIRVWGGYGDLVLDGQTFSGIGDRGLAQSSGGAIGGSAQGLKLQLSGIEPEVLELLDADEVARAPVVVWRLIFSPDGRTLLDAQVFDRGRLDQVRSIETVGGEAVVEAQVENAARGLGRRGGRMRTDADQRLIKADDGFFRNVSFAAEKQLYWGGRRPSTAGSALGGGGFDGGGGGGGGGGFGFNTDVRQV